MNNTKELPILRLSLKQKWFDMSKAGLKLEDYREITPYWVKRLIDFSAFPKESKDDWKNNPENFIYDLLNGHSLEVVLNGYYAKLKDFSINRMTLGYPKSADTSRIVDFEHLGIEVRDGIPEWGAEPGKLYFVIIHGPFINYR